MKSLKDDRFVYVEEHVIWKDKNQSKVISILKLNLVGSDGKFFYHT